MRRASWLVLASWLLACGAASNEDGPPSNGFLVGYAEADVTPANGTVMGGYGMPGGLRVITGVHDRLRAQATLFQNLAGQAFLLIEVDDTGWFWEFGGTGPGLREVRTRIVEGLAGRVTLEARDILIASSHSHAAPDMMGFWQTLREPIPRAQLEQYADWLVDVGVRAADDLVPATLHTGSTTLTGYTGADSHYTDRLDDAVGVLQARGLDGKPLVTFVNYGKHPTLLPEGNTLASADFIWGLRSELEPETGAPVVFLLGFEAAVHDGPKVVELEAADDYERAYAMGKVLADAVRPVLGGLAASDDTTILARETTTSSPIEGSIMVQVYEMLHMPFRAISGQEGAWVLDEMPVSWHKLGPVELAAFPGEGTPAYSFRLRDHVVSPLALVLANANDAIGYLVDPETAAADTSGQLEHYELRMGLGAPAGPAVWSAHESLGWFDGAWKTNQ